MTTTILLSGFRTDRIGSYINKDPESYLDYTVDWSDWMEVDDELAASSWAIQTIAGDTAPLTTDANTFNSSTNVATIFIRGGSVSNNYTITNTITTSNGLVSARYFRIFVQDRSA
tara:strand:- start:177 stop:521 length:345 start_codon:yes stop_codon:yes gene_type:complete